MTSVVFMGRKDVSAQCLAWLSQINNVKVVAVLTDNHLSISPTSEKARELNIPILTLEELIESVKNNQIQFDIAFSMLYWRKIPNSLIQHAKKGIINFHPAPLPEYKGTAGYNLAILEGLEKWSVTAHYVDESIDTGSIIKLSTFDIDKNNETAKSLEKISRVYLFDLFRDVSTKALDSVGLLDTKPNNGGRYISRQKMEEMKKIDIKCDDIDRKIRAFWFPPYDGAYIEINNKKYTLINREILETLADSSASSLFTKEENKKC